MFSTRPRLALACLSLAFAATSATACSNPPLDVAPDVDLARFQGKWYEVAKLPRPTQASCTGTTAFYTFTNGGLDVVNECHLDTLDGKVRQNVARADGTDVSAKLALDVGGFKGDYWILEVGEHYEYAVVGTPSRDYLWILSRTPKLDAPVLSSVIARAAANKFETARLEYTLQPTP